MAKTKKAKAKTRPKKTLSRAGKQARAEKHELFCLEFIKDQNAARAARDAGYSEDTAKEIGHRLLTYVHIKARIKKLLDERMARTLLSGDEILLGIKHLAVADSRRLLDPVTGCVLPPGEWPDDVAQAVASFEVIEKFHPLTGQHTGYVKKVKLWDKPKSQENLGRNKGLFKDVVENQGSVTVVTVDEQQVRDTLGKIEKEY